jgi:RNA polymerase sigma-70 factor (ECF subfamily)
VAQVDKAQVQASAAPRVERSLCPARDFESFFHAYYRDLLKIAMYVGATKQEAEDAVMATMEELLRRWGQIDSQFAYARRAVVSNFLKDKTRGLDRVRHRQVERGDAPPEADEDPGLTAWEDRQWVIQILESLPPAQREAMAFIVDSFTPVEVASLLGKTPAAVRRNLCDARHRLRAALRQGHEPERPDQTPVSARGEER